MEDYLKLKSKFLRLEANVEQRIQNEATKWADENKQLRDSIIRLRNELEHESFSKKKTEEDVTN